MIGICFAALAFCSPAKPEDAAAIVSKMLAVYANTKTLSGTVKFTQSLGNVSVSIDTTLQFERPGKLYIRQERRTATDPRTWVVTADGKYFSYDSPEELTNNRQRLIEAFGEGQDLRDAYNAASRSMGDRDAPLAVAISRQRDLEFLRNQWASLEIMETKPAGAEGLTVVTGKWRETGRVPPSGTFEMWINADGELKRYVRRETVAAEGMSPQAVTSVWEVSLTLNGKIDPTLFQLVRNNQR